MKTLIVYYTKTGHTLEATKATAKGIKDAGSEVDILEITKFEPALLKNYDSFIVAAPCWDGGITDNGVPKYVTRVLESLPEYSLHDMRCGGISVHASKGGDTTVKTIGDLLNEKGATDYREGPVAIAGTPLSVDKGQSVSSEDLERYKIFGSRFVE
ncbi:MAG: hypothetical protein BKP49_04680 [Treponema sp. CETP13]|nr:MAG: hypothetical protein BKP49_04680 [Treponema sp. CETP13]